MSSYGNPPQDPYGQQGQPGHNPYDPPPAYGQGAYGQGAYGQGAYGQGAYGQDPYGQGAYGQPGGAAFASWPKRVGSYLIDAIVVAVAMIPYYIGIAMAGASVQTEVDPTTGQITSTGGGMSGLALGLVILGVVLGLAAFVWNQCFKQGRTGYSIGKGVLGTKLIKLDTGQPIGAGMSFVRQIAHILDQLPCYIGYLWPLWDSKRQTFADKVTGTVVIEQPKP